MTVDKEATRIQRMFAGIAGRYDLLNHLLSLGQDSGWRRRAALLSAVQPGDSALDLCCGTGDMALALTRRMQGQGLVLAADFTAEMLDRARPKTAGSPIRLLRADALSLPFRDGSFDVCTVAWGIRNVADTAAGLREMQRVLKPGGRLVTLESARPSALPARWYLSTLMPFIGNRLSGSRDHAYSYLHDSVAEFPSPKAFQAMMRQAGLREVRYELKSFGAIAIHIGVK